MIEKKTNEEATSGKTLAQQNAMNIDLSKLSADSIQCIKGNREGSASKWGRRGRAG
jgi:hypothetical protein